MNHSLYKRSLSFEQMEERLALSTTSGSEYLSSIMTLTTEQGGFISFDSTGSSFVLSGTKNYGDLTTNSGFPLVVRGEHIYQYSSDIAFGDVFGSPRAMEITPIAQPHMGPDEIGKGAVSIAEIFRPSTPGFNLEHKLVNADPIVETVRQAPDGPMGSSLAIARARDVYFEVAGQTEKVAVRPRLLEDLSQDQAVPDSFEKPVITQETENSSSIPAKPLNSSAEALVIPQHTRLTDGNPARVDEALPIRVDGEMVRDTNAEATQAQQQATDMEDKVSDLSPRDRVLADWRRSDLLADEAVSLRTKEPEEHLAAWPMLAALVGCGWLVKSRRRQVGHGLNLP